MPYALVSAPSSPSCFVPVHFGGGGGLSPLPLLTQAKRRLIEARNTMKFANFFKPTSRNLEMTVTVKKF